jgi:hypothetical protein
VIDESALRTFVSTTLTRYNEALERYATEQELDFLITSIDDFIPGVLFTDLYYWGDRERTDEELVEEVIARAKILSAEGRRGVIIRAIDQYRQEPMTGWADQMIDDYTKTLSELSGPS